MSRPETDRAVRMLISGRVQGVGFRYFTRQVAERLELVGWVKNLPGGEVEVQVLGPPEALVELQRELRRGPTGSRVDDLVVSELAAPGDWVRFEIAF